jgi:hypothetical protein
MNTLRNKPKGNYINKVDWPKLYVLVEHWKSGLEFYTKDLKFLHHWIDKYFMWISKKENIDMLRKIEIELLKIDK